MQKFAHLRYTKQSAIIILDVRTRELMSLPNKAATSTSNLKLHHKISHLDNSIASNGDIPL